MVNRDANDNHSEVVIRLLLGMPVGNTACPECYQPKFWYSFTAILSQILFVRTEGGIIFLSELINFFVGIFTLVFIWKFIKQIASSKGIALLTFAVIALNSDLIAINSQGTNDSFVILFGVGATYFLWKYIKTQQFTSAIYMSLLVALAVISKGSGLVILAAVVCCLLFYVWVARKQRIYTFYALLLTIGISLFSIFFFTPYVYYLQTYGRVDVVNMTKSPPPQFFKETIAKRPGIVSIASGYLTFQYFDLLKTPYISNDSHYSVTRTSLWSQLYGRSFSAHFPQWPPTWADKSEGIILLTRLIFIFGLLPTIIFILGFVQSLYEMITGSKTQSFTWIFFINLGAFVSMLLIYTYDYRDYSFMKTLFLYPALLGIIYFLIRGFESINDLFKKYKHVLRVGTGALLIFLGLEMVDILLLIGHLS